MTMSRKTDTKLKKRVTFATPLPKPTESDHDQTEIDGPDSHEAAKNSSQIGTASKSLASAPDRHSISEFASEMAEIPGLLTEGSNSIQMVRWIKEYGGLSAQVDEDRRDSASDGMAKESRNSASDAR